MDVKKVRQNGGGHSVLSNFLKVVPHLLTPATKFWPVDPTKYLTRLWIASLGWFIMVNSCFWVKYLAVDASFNDDSVGKVFDV